MVVTVVYRGLKPDGHLKDFIYRKLSYSLDSQLCDKAKIKVFLSLSGDYFQITLLCEKNIFPFHSYAESLDVYAAVSIAANRMKRQIAKQVRRNHVHRPIFMPVRTVSENHIEDYLENGFEFMSS